MIDNPTALLRSYLAHRRKRESEIIEAVRLGDRRIEAIVSRVYQGLTDELLPRAKETVAAHLRSSNARAGRRRRDDVWHIIEP